MRSLLFTVAGLLVSAHAFAWRVAAWIPPWDANALASIEVNGAAVAESNPIWYSWNADGTIAKNWNAENETWRAAMSGTRLVPTIQNVVDHAFDGNAAATMLATAASRDAHADAVVQLAVSEAFDGIDIDYERVPAASRASFTAFLGALAQKLHAANKTLSVSVYPKTSDAANWNGPGAEDWAAIGGIADAVKIMAYDYSWSSSAPGPIAPLDWLDGIAGYAESVIPPQKIVIGLPFYGYDWSGGVGRSMTYAQAMAAAQSAGATIAHDANGEATFAYGDHVVYFQDAASYARKLQLLQQKHPRIDAIGNWALGQEDPAVWSVIRSSASPATPAPLMARRRSARH